MQERFLLFGSHGLLGLKVKEHLEASGREVIRGDREGAVPVGVDVIINCASYGNMYGQTDEKEIYRANVTLLKTALGGEWKQFVNISSSSVLLPKLTSYSQVKKEGEEICQKAGAISIRPSSITGPGEQKEHLIPKLIDSCLRGTEMPFVGEPTHDYIHVLDVVSAIGLLLVIPEARGKVFNVSSGVITTNEQVLDLVEECTGAKANIKRVDSMRPYDTKDWKVDNSEMRALGWQPTISLRESIQQMVAEYDE